MKNRIEDTYKICGYECLHFECPYNDCKNNAAPTKEEAEMLKRSKLIAERS